MPNSPIQRRADAPIPPPVSANKIVRGAAQQQVLETRVATSTQTAAATGSSGGGGGGPPSGAAGGRLAGTYPNPTFAAFGPGVGTKGTQVRYPSFTLDAAGTVSAWSDFAARPFEFNIKDYGCAGDGSTDDTTNFQAAITAAAAVHGIVVVPYGVYKITAALTLPGGFGGYLSFRGDGFRASIIRQDAAADGLDFDFSAAGDGGIQIKDIGIMANHSGCLTALKLTGSTGSTYNLSCIVTGIEVNANGVNSKGWNAGFDIYGCANVTVDKCFAYGNASNYVNPTGAGGAGGIRFRYCVNCFLNDFTLLFWKKGLDMPSVMGFGGSQGVVITGLIGVEMMTPIYSDSSTIYLNGFVLDNGNLNVAHEGIQINNADTSLITNGQILQYNGANQIYVNNSTKVSVTNVDFAHRNSVTGAAVLFTGTSVAGTVTGCTFASLEVQCDAGTSKCKAYGNTNENTRNSSDAGDNHLGDAMSFTGVVTTPNPAISTSYSFTVNITDAGLGQFIGATVVNMSDDVYKFRIDQSTSTATSLAVVLTLFTGLTLGAGQQVRYGITVAP